MKVLGILVALFALCVILCCGVGAFLAPSTPTTNTTSVASQEEPTADVNSTHSTTKTASAASRNEPATGDNSTHSPKPASNSKVDRLLAERTATYEKALAQWQASNDDRAKAETALANIRAQLAEAEAQKPTSPVFETREWSTLDEKYKTDAILMSTDNKTATLRKPDGRTIEVPKDKLIAESRIYIQNAFNNLTKYREALGTWEQSNHELDERAKKLMETIAAADQPAPTRPQREDIVAEVEAEEAKEKERQRMAQLERERAAAEAARYKMGDTVSVGYTSYAIWSAKWVDRISDNPYLNDTPDANFLLVNITVRNNDSKARQIPPFKLVDENRAEYQTSSKSFGIADAIGPLDSLNPSVSKRGTILFDVPKKRTYKLQLDGGFWSAEKKTLELTID